MIKNIDKLIFKIFLSIIFLVYIKFINYKYFKRVYNKIFIINENNILFYIMQY